MQACRVFLKRVFFFTAASALALLVLGQQITGVQLHEYAAVVFCVFILWHIGSNRWFFKNPLSGLRLYALWRLFTAAGLLISFAAVMVSGIVMSQYVFAPLNLPGMGLMRGVHNSASLYFVLFGGAHIGLHSFALLSLIRDNLGTLCCRIFIVLCAYLAVYGFYTICTYDNFERLTFQVSFGFFDYDAPPIFFFVDQLSQLISMAFVSAVISRQLLFAAAKD